MNQSISELVNALPETESVAQLQDRLNAVGIKEDLTALPAAQVSEKFKQLIGEFLTRSIGEISIEQIQALTAVVKEADNTLETTPLVKDQTFNYRVAGPITALLFGAPQLFRLAGLIVPKLKSFLPGDKNIPQNEKKISLFCC